MRFLILTTFSQTHDWFCQFSYRLFTETELYTADFAQNTLFGFPTFFIIFNLVLLVLASLAGYKWKREY